MAEAVSAGKPKEHFKHFRFLIIESSDLTGEDLETTKQTLEKHGAENITIKATSQDVIKDSVLYQLTHIVALSPDFKEYAFAEANMIPVVTPNWIKRSIDLRRLVSLRPYCPDDRLFLKDVFVAVSGIPEGDKDAIVLAIIEFGGQYQENVTKFTTHVIAMETASDACVIASLIPEKNIKCVLPHWVEDCMKQQTKVDETPYLLDQVTVPLADKGVIIDKFLTLSFSEDLYNTGTEVEFCTPNSTLKDKSFYIGSDLMLGDRTKTLITKLIMANGATILEEISKATPEGDNTEKCYIGKYRAGDEFISASKAGFTVGNLSWFFSILSHKAFVSPLNNLLHYPISKVGLPEFNSLTFSATNFTGDGRQHLEKLIFAIGASFSKSLNTKVDFLICAKPVGAKYEAAKKWSSVKIRNHLWIEDCYKEWQFLNNKEKQYTDISGPTKLGKLLGSAKFDNTSIRKFYDLKYIPQAKGKSLGKFYEEESSLSKGQENMDPYVPLLTSGRKAAVKAAQKLHSDMEELNAFQKQRVRKDIPKLPNEVKEPKRKPGPMQDLKARKLEDAVDEDQPKAKKQKADKRKSKSPNLSSSPVSFNFRIITTGCDDVSKFDSQLLSTVGIHMEKDPLKANVIVAPRIMRTEKFLATLAVAPKHILHPKFLTDVIKAHKQNKLADFKVEDYSLDKFSSANINELPIPLLDLLSNAAGRTKSNKKLFHNLAFNISNYVPGGPVVINRILAAHGLTKKAKLIKSVSTLKNIKSLEICHNDKDCYLITAKVEKSDKNGDNVKLIEHFKSVCENSDKVPKIVEWNWIVASIFSMNLKGHEEFIIS